VKPERVPHDEAEKRNEIRAARTRLTVAQQKGDADAEQAARSDLAALHAKPYSGNQSSTVYMFSNRAVSHWRIRRSISGPAVGMRGISCFSACGVVAIETQI
jgi:hypothetical protein